MKIKDALAVLNIQSNPVTSADIKIAYQKSASLYHPDRNPAGLEMMKIVNAARDALKDFEGSLDEVHNENYGEILNNALNSVIHLGLTIEVCGTWIWLSGDTKPHRKILKDVGYQWAAKKACWYFRAEKNRSYNRSSWSMDKIRGVYGSQTIKDKERRLIEAI